MTGETDRKDRNEARRIAIVLVALVGLLALAAFMMLPLLADFAATYLAPGLGLRDAAMIAFFITVVLMVILAFASGDGLLGELQFVLAGFFLFFVIIWLLIAWAF